MHDVDTEATPLRARPRPYEPTQAERDAHEPLHAPYRSWCRACVAGRGRSDAHHVSPSSENAVPVYAIDYAYLSSDADEQRASPILVGRDSITKWTDADVLPSKGTSHEHSIRTLVNNVRNTGHIKVIIKSDNEPAIVDLKHQAARRLQADHGISVTFKESPVSDSQSNGLAELAVREVKGLARTLKHHVEEMHGITLPPDHVSMPWLLQHVGAIISRAQRGADGKTPWERLKGRPYRKQLPCFGDKLLYSQQANDRAGTNRNFMMLSFLASSTGPTKW